MSAANPLARNSVLGEDIRRYGVEPTLVSPAAKFVRCRESTPAESSESCGSVV